MKRLFTNAAIMALAGLILVSCRPATAPPPVPTTAVMTPAVQQTAPHPTMEPTATQAPGRVILVATENEVPEFQAALAALAEESGLVMETRSALQPGELGEDSRVVVLLQSPANLSDLRNAAPEAHFIVISNNEIESSENLSVIRQRPENQAFVAGFVSVLLWNDWRAAGLLPEDNPLGGGLSEAFVNGGRYYCGACSSGWPLGITYPVVASLPSGSEGAAWQSAAASLFENQKVEVYYISAAAAKPELINDLAGKQQFGKTVLVVGELPPPDALQEQWAASVSFDLIDPLRQLWADALSGSSSIVEAPLRLTHVNSENLGEGRLRLVKELMAEITAGRISPFTVPAQ